MNTLQILFFIYVLWLNIIPRKIREVFLPGRWDYTVFHNRKKLGELVKHDEVCHVNCEGTSGCIVLSPQKFKPVAKQWLKLNYNSIY